MSTRFETSPDGMSGWTEIPQCKPIPAPEPDSDPDRWVPRFDIRVEMDEGAKPMMVGRLIKVLGAKHLGLWGSPSGIYYVYRCEPVVGLAFGFDLIVKAWHSQTVDYVYDARHFSSSVK